MIFYEKDRAEQLLENGSLSLMSYNDLSLLARYFKYLGKSKKQIKKSILSFCKKYSQDFNEILARRKIDNAVKSTQFYSLRIKKDINITKKEFDTISSVSDFKLRKILFVMLAIAKYAKYNDNRIKKRKTKYSDNFYVNFKFTTIIKMARVNVSKDCRNSLLYDLENTGLIKTTMTGAFQVNFVDKEEDSFVIITDMNDIISFFPLCCEKCGKRMDINSKSKMHEMCPECYAEDLHERQRVAKRDSIRKIRNNK